jgi:hypothetical protein
MNAASERAEVLGLELDDVSFGRWTELAPKGRTRPE